MKLRGDRLKFMAEQVGLGTDDLIQSLVGAGYAPGAAQTAVRNWTAGRDHPRCKAPDMRALAGAIGCEVKDIARFTSQVRHHRGSTQKARLVADLIRGKTVDEALNLLTFSTKRAATNMKKALAAAVADAELADADVTALVVAESRVDEGPQIKRFRPKDRGRAHKIIKQTSHITVGVEEKN